MSIPTYTLRFAGTWNSTARYIYADIVVSPADNQAYVWINQTTPSIGGADPSVALGDWINMPPAASGDITGVIAGTGLSGGGSVGVVSLANAGVLSLDSQTGALTTKCGGWHKNNNQTINTLAVPPAPSTVGLTWIQSSYGDTTTISHNGPNSQFYTVNQNGIYNLSVALQYANLGSATLTDTTFRIILLLNRGGNSANILTTTFDYPNNTPANPTHILSGTYQLNAGDIISWQTQQYLSAGSFTINGQSAPPTAFDYNSFWNWQLVKPL